MAGSPHPVQDRQLKPDWIYAAGIGIPQARAAYRSADLVNLQQAMQNYTWAVKGLDVSAS